MVQAWSRGDGAYNLEIKDDRGMVRGRAYHWRTILSKPTPPLGMAYRCPQHRMAARGSLHRHPTQTRGPSTDIQLHMELSTVLARDHYDVELTCKQSRFKLFHDNTLVVLVHRRARLRLMIREGLSLLASLNKKSTLPYVYVCTHIYIYIYIYNIYIHIYMGIYVYIHICAGSTCCPPLQSRESLAGRPTRTPGLSPRTAAKESLGGP